MQMRQVWAVSGGFFLVFIAITLTNRPHVTPRQPGAANVQPVRGADGSPAPVALRPDFLKGVAYLCPGAAGLGEAASDAELRRLVGAGVGWISLTPPFFQDTGPSTAITADPAQTPTLTALQHAIATAHGLGLRVMLRPVVVSRDGTHRQDLVPLDPQAWLDSYAAAVEPYIELARSNQVEIISLGAGYSRLESAPGWWELIRRTRVGFAGRLTYGAASAGSAYQQVPFWSQLDYIGIEAYAPVAADQAGEPELFQGWQSQAGAIEAWQARQGGKQVLITSVGMPAIAGSAVAPDRPILTASPDPGLQADACHAFFAAFSGRTWLAGAYWYAWEQGVSPTEGSPFAIQDKPALGVLTAAYGGSATP